MHPAIAAAMARRMKMTVHGLPGRPKDNPFTCYPRNASEEAKWTAKYRAMGCRVEIDAPE